MFKVSLLYFLVLASTVAAAPAGSIDSTSASLKATSVSSAPNEAQTVPPASNDPNFPLWSQDTNENVQLIRDTTGTTQIVLDNIELDRQNPNLYAPPSSDKGIIPNAKWPFALSHNRLETGGWARQQNQDVMPIATAMAGVHMRLEAGAIRELHWHSIAEWAYVLKGSTAISAVDQDGRNYYAVVNEGDLWYFPPGIPHSLQATDDNPDGTEFLLVFDSGTFNEDETFLLTDWTAHIPKEVLAKNFQTDISAFDHIPSEQLYIFPSEPPAKDEIAPSDPNGHVPLPYSYALSKAPATPLAGGSIKIFDPSVFAVATTIVGALVTIEPGAMRELHWHPTQPEWSYFITGEARMTLFASSATANTFNYRAGDIGYVPPSFGHYIENTGNTTVQYLELFASDRVEDISLQQWLALTPPALVKAHFDISDETIAHLNKTKQFVVGPK